ncbi:MULTISPECIES: glycosyltransferase family 4 protein [Planktothricoides]|uniref:Glycosyltransferase family 4 protein n=2 Tax=Planktothricoides raciborskii TaxID=132608 RepID=A0AAU8JC52_9CYAN|nr:MULTISPECIES: glycosyltransferase family 4 protein [Planktothricoides]KOR38003.1 group 1 glycosyl transferase [Planktothricoides sp. SR001]MBD2542865.1 glycosyltransferase family 4 protein [Planktothricoides raciborskii FACHB-1370]MBD2581388.1 glycosyltransferase family 4 protein [Planktothricoides raciborskii FACHB-1261]
MKILIYSYNYHPEPIGIAPLMTELAEGLVKRGHQVRVVTSMPNYPEREIYPDYQGKWYLTEERNGVTIQRCVVWIRPRPNLLDRLLLDGTFVFNSLPYALSGWRPDVVLATVPPLPVCIAVSILARLRQTPVVLNIQDIQHEAAWEVGLLKNKWLFQAFAKLEKFACRHANKISVIADGFVENLQQKNVPLEKIVMIPNWVNVNFIRPIPKETNSFIEKHHLPGKFVVLYSGNIALTQQLPTAIKAAAKLNHIPDIVFVIVGETKAINRVREYCEMFSAHHVKLLNFEPRETLPDMLAAADVGLVVQKHNVIGFNMPSKIPVLLASGCPIAASVPLTGTAAKAVQKSGGGVVVPPEDEDALAAAILDLYQHPEKRAALSAKGRQYAIENYAYEQALNRYESLFSELVEENTYRLKALSK